MPTINYVEHDGTAHIVAVKGGISLMEGAIQNNVPGIDADCGGACACATCHVYIDDDRVDRAAISAIEQSMLEFVDGAAPNSRLSCQVTVSDRLDGLVVQLPEKQG